MTTICERCKEPREVSRIRKGNKHCRACSLDIIREKINVNNLAHRVIKNPKGRKVSQYLRVCPCGDEKWVGYIPKKNSLCLKCASSKNGYHMSQRNRKEESEKIRYKRICSNPECGKVDYLLANPEKYRTTGLCLSCNGRATGKMNSRGDEDMRYMRICPECPEDDNTIEVTVKANAGIKLCRKHRKIPIGKDRKQVDNYIPRKRSIKKESTAAIKAAQQLNRAHKEAIADGLKKKKIPEQALSDEDMVAKFLNKNKPSVEFGNEPIPYSSCKTGSCSSTSVLGA